LLDESLEIMTGLWSGEPFSYQGKHYQVSDLTFVPKPVQSPRIPIWVVGVWGRPKSMRRALRYDGILPTFGTPEDPFRQEAPNELAALRQFIDEHRTATTPFDIIVEGVTPGADPAAAAAIVGPRAEAGATWWIESRWEAPNEPDDLRRRIRQGPPALR
jgi:alkanesulfonate monooxygenase SsuD/methylene tetrahydromethanopterin reductase-like flavin-dependent oxidoreductase (luciferase family)